LLLRIFDQHDDGIVYKDNYLNLELKDTTSDGNNELIFSGSLKFTGEKESDPVRFEPITVVYSLNCDTGKLSLLKNTSDYSIELNDSQKDMIECTKK